MRIDFLFKVSQNKVMVRHPLLISVEYKMTDIPCSRAQSCRFAFSSNSFAKKILETFHRPHIYIMAYKVRADAYVVHKLV